MYLKQETRKFPGFRDTGCGLYLCDPSSDVKSSFEIHQDSNGRLYFEFERPDSTMQEFIHDLIEEFVCYVPRKDSKCKVGFYKTSEAEATIEPYKAGYDECYRIAIRGDDLSSMLKLYRQIRAGNVEPDYEW